MLRTRTSRPPLLLALVLATSCAPEVGEVVNGELAGVVFKGPVASATVTAYAADGAARGAELGSATSDDEGAFSALSVGAHRGPLLVCATGGSYVEESTGTATQLGSDSLCGLVPAFELGQKHNVAITPWTHLEAGLSECFVRTGKESSPAAAAERARSRLTEFLNKGQPDFALDSVPFDVTSKVAPSLTAEVWSGLLTAALSESAKQLALASGLQPGVSLTASSLLQSLYKDINDDSCVFDGLETGGRQLLVGTVPLSPDSLRGAATGLASSLLKFVRVGRNASGVAESDVRGFAEALALHQSDIFGPIFAPPDFEPPTITFTEPITTTISGAVTITAVAADAGGIAACAFSSPDPLPAVQGSFNDDDTECTLSYTLNTGPFDDGPLVIRATATDTIGNPGEATLTVVVDNSVPEIRVTSPSNNATISGTVTIAATASDPAGIETLRLVSHEALLDTLPAPDAYQAVWDTSTSFEGETQLIFEATDANGVSSTTTVTVYVDNIAATTIAGALSFGAPIVGATITAYEYANQERAAELAIATTDNSGLFQLVAQSAYQGPVLLVAIGGDFQDPATGKVLPLGAELLSPLPSVIAGAAHTRQINPWTTLAVARAKAETSDASIALTTSMALIGQHLRRPSPLLIAETPTADLASQVVATGDDRAILGLATAALSRLAANLSIASGGQVGTLTPPQLVERLALDVQDGSFDGSTPSGPVALTATVLANSYTTRRTLTTALANFVTDKPLDGVTHPRNNSGITLDSLLVGAGLIEMLAMDGNAALYPTSSPPIPFDATPPVITITPEGLHADAFFGDALRGTVELSIRAADADSFIDRLDILAPDDFIDLRPSVQDVLVRIDNEVLPNVATVAPACGIPATDPQIQNLDDPTNQVCVCVEAADEVENTKLALFCFTRPPPDIIFNAPTPDDGAIIDGSVAVRASVLEGFALGSATFTTPGLSDTSAELALVYGSISSDYVDTANQPDIAIEVSAIDVLGRESTATRTISRTPLTTTFSGLLPDTQLVLSDFPVQYGASVTGGYNLDTCSWEILDASDDVILSGPADSVSGRTCVIQDTLTSTTLSDGGYRFRVSTTDVVGRSSLEESPFSQDTTPFAILVSLPDQNSSTNTTTVVIAGSVTDGAAATSIRAIVTKPTAATVTRTGSYVGSSWTISLPSNDVTQEGVYTYYVEADLTAGGTARTPQRTFYVDRTPPIILGHSQGVAQDGFRQGRASSGYGTVGKLGTTFQLVPAASQTSVNWSATPTFAVWATRLEQGPQYAFQATDDTTPTSQLVATYGASQSCPSSQQATTLASGSNPFRAALKASAITHDLSTETGGNVLCLALWVEDLAGNKTSYNVQFRWDTVAAPAYILQNSVHYDREANSSDMMAWASPQGTADLFRLSGVPGAGYVAADLFVHNPWPSSIEVKPMAGTAFDLEVKTTERILHAYNRRATRAWFDGTIKLRNPRAALADDNSSEFTTGGPRWTSVYTSSGGAFVYDTIRRTNASIQASGALSTSSLYYLHPYRSTISAPGYRIVLTEDEPAAPLSTTDDLAGTLVVYRLNSDGTLGSSIGVGTGGYYTIPAGERAVALWLVRHAAAAGHQIFTQPGTGPIDDNNCGLLRDDVHATTYNAPIAATDILVKEWAGAPACFTVVPSNINTHAYCGTTASDAFCRIDKVWRELDYLRIAPGVTLRQETRSGAIESFWSGPGVQTLDGARQIP